MKRARKSIRQNNSCKTISKRSWSSIRIDGSVGSIQRKDMSLRYLMSTSRGKTSRKIGSSYLQEKGSKGFTMFRSRSWSAILRKLRITCRMPWHPFWPQFSATFTRKRRSGFRFYRLLPSLTVLRPLRLRVGARLTPCAGLPSVMP